MRRAIFTAGIALMGVMAFLPRGLVADTNGVPRLDHAFVIILENHDYCQILAANNGCTPAQQAAALAAAPKLNQLAAKNGVATQYYGVAHPSEPNYVAIVGGNYFGIADDNDYSCPNGAAPNTVGCGALSPTGGNYPNHTIYGPNLAQQMDDHGTTWKGYFQALPNAGATGNCYPSTSDCLYASKHNPFINFASVQDHDLNKILPIEQLQADLQSGQVPNLSVIAPDQCHDMHGLSSCPNDTTNITTADTYTANLVNEIRTSKAWQHGLDAIIITVDEGNTNLGCCDAGSTSGGGSGGGGNVATIVITNHDARHPDQDHDGFTDTTPYNHYSMMSTIEGGFDLGCAQNTCDTAHVKPMTPLLRDP